MTVGHVSISSRATVDALTYSIIEIVTEEVLPLANLVICPSENADGEVGGAEVRAADEGVISTVQEHAEAEHDLELSRSDVEQMMQEV